ncbi:MAG: hypothetical protein JWQ42_1236 [Edaphobacter sp.]|nr:hypothetical protein [Edaphobacter sp.]
MPSLDSNPQPPQPSQGRNRDLLVPWLLVAGLFVVSLISAIATMLHGMARIGIDKANLSWWFHPLTLISECGLILSTAGILALVIVSFRRALKSQ